MRQRQNKQANWFKRRRQQLRLTQAELAQLVGVGIGTVQTWENSQSTPLYHGRKLAEVLETPFEVIAVEIIRAAEAVAARRHGREQ